MAEILYGSDDPFPATFAFVAAFFATEAGYLAGEFFANAPHEFEPVGINFPGIQARQGGEV